MRFGKRRKDAEQAADEPVVVAAPEPSPATDSWTVPAAADATLPGAAEGPSSGPPEPVAAAPAYAPSEPVVEGEAVEIAAAETEQPEPAAMPPAAAYEPPLAFAPPPPAPEPRATPFPVAGEPVLVAASGPERDHTTSLGAAAETFASGHGPTLAPAWPEGIKELAAERPEVVVGAAFVGGLLAAMIIRRLGN